jgi:hypothetical protein
VQTLLALGIAHVMLPLHVFVGQSDHPVRPLHRAARLGLLAVVRLLIDETPDDDRTTTAVLSATTKYGFTALHLCSAATDLDRRQDVSALPARAGSLRSDSCIRDGHAEVADALIHSGCDVTVKNYRGKTAWDLARAANVQTVLAVFEFHASQGHVELHKEQQRREHRPDVEEYFRDDLLELDSGRLHAWSIDPYDNWHYEAEGGFGKVYRVENVSPPVEVDGRHFQRMVVKVAKASWHSSLDSELADGARHGERELSGEIQELAGNTMTKSDLFLHYVCARAHPCLACVQP